MTQSEFMRSIRTVAKLLNAGGMLQQTYKTSSLEPSEEFISVARSVNPNYKHLYRVGLRNRDYNFLLADFAFLQFFRRQDGEELLMRFAYYANPFIVTPFEEFAETYDGADYEEYLQLLEESGDRDDALVIRYEVATRDYIELRHPTAHFHVGLHEGRWPVDKVLSPVAFTMFITKLFYAAYWTSDADEQLAQEKQSCKLLEDELFSAKDKGHLYIT
jgi:hypothetical protein